MSDIEFSKDGDRVQMSVHATEFVVRAPSRLLLYELSCRFQGMMEGSRSIVEFYLDGTPSARMICTDRVVQFSDLAEMFDKCK